MTAKNTVNVGLYPKLQRYTGEIVRIGILTFHNAINLGAILQAYALNYYIDSNIGKSEIINYIPNSEIPKIPYRLYNILHTGKILFMDRGLYCKENRFRRFRSCIDTSERTYLGDSGIANAHFDYDVIISGSDQILNTTLTGNSKAYYLDFFGGKKISYASSFGRKDVSKEEISLIRSELPKFSALSVREQSGADIIKKETGIEPQLVLDPVFLLSKDEWSKRCNEQLKLPKKYIFVYSMEASPVLENAVSLIKEDTRLPVIVVRGGGKPGLIEGKEDSTCGPEEFLRYMRDAELVITNSFHGTAFSLIFEKKFLCVAHSTRNARLENIMNLVDKKDLLLYSPEAKYQEKIVDGLISIKQIERYINISKEYLKESI